MAKLHFLRADVEKIMAHAKNAKNHNMGYGNDKKMRKPQLMLVGDQGIYLLSNGIPNMPRADGKEGSFVVYAKEASPDCMDFHAWWENKNRIFGGDDGVENIDLEHFETALATYPKGERYLILDMTQTSLSVVLFKPKAPRAKRAAA